MKRAAMIYCANLPIDRFKVLKQRDQLPFPDEDFEDGTLGGNAYTLDHAFRLRLMADLMGGEGDELKHGGLSPSYAEKVVSKAMLKFPRHPLNQIEPLDWWAGVLILEEEKDGETQRFSSWFCGELKCISAWVDEECKRENYTLRPVRLFIANASLAADSVRDRAEELGLPEAKDFSVIER